jgi:hypothetical protein
MSWEELTKLREKLQEDTGDSDIDSDTDTSTDAEDLDVSQDNDDLVKSYDSDRHEWIEGDLIDALAALHEIQEAAPSVKKDAPKSPPKGYPSDKGKYADPTNFKYPLDTEKHVRAALAYFSKASNRSKGGYSPQEQKFMWKRIIAAARKYGIELSDDVKKHAEKLGESISDGGEVIKMEMKEAELAELIGKIVKEQMVQNPGGALNQGQKGSGGMEAYQQQTRIPPEIEAINTQLEAFKQKHAAHEAAFQKMGEDFGKSNKDLSAKVDTLMKQVQAMQEARKEQADTDTSDTDTSDTDTSDTSDSEISEAKKGAKGAKAAAAAKAAGTKKTGKEEEDTSDTGTSDTEDNGQQEQVHTKKKVKEQAQQAHAEGLVATRDMEEGTGVSPPGFGASDDEAKPRSFGDVMNRASRRRRGGIGAST